MIKPFFVLFTSATIQSLLFFSPIISFVPLIAPPLLFFAIFLFILETVLSSAILFLFWQKRFPFKNSLYVPLAVIRKLIFLSECIFTILEVLIQEEIQENDLSLLACCIFLCLLLHKRTFKLYEEFANPHSKENKCVGTFKRIISLATTFGSLLMLDATIFFHWESTFKYSYTICLLVSFLLAFLLETDEIQILEKKTPKKEHKKDPMDITSKGKALASVMATIVHQNKKTSDSQTNHASPFHNNLHTKSDPSKNRNNSGMHKKNDFDYCLESNDSKMFMKSISLGTKDKDMDFNKLNLNFLNKDPFLSKITDKNVPEEIQQTKNMTVSTTYNQSVNVQLRFWQYLPSIFTEGVGIVDSSILFLFNPPFLIFLKTGQLDSDFEFTSEEFLNIQQNWKDYASKFEVTLAEDEVYQKLTFKNAVNEKLQPKLNLREELEYILSIPENVLADNEIQVSYLFRRRPVELTSRSYNKKEENKIYEIKVFRKKFKEEKSYLTLLKVTEMTQQVKLYSVSSSNKFKKFLISSLAHEVKTPFNHLQSTMKILKMDNNQENVEKALSSFKLFLLVFHGIIDIALEQISGLEFKCETFELDKVLKKLLNLYKPLFESRETVLEYSGGDPEELTVVENNKQMLEIIIFQFLSNCLKFSNGGKVSVKLKVMKDLSEFELKFKDKGVGMSDLAQENLSRFIMLNINSVFNGEKISSFSTGANLGFMIILTLVRKMYHSLGILASSSQKIIETLNNAIRFKSVQGLGSTFYLRLPLRKVRNNFIPLKVNQPLSIKYIFEKSPLVSFNKESKQSIDETKNQKDCSLMERPFISVMSEEDQMLGFSGFEGEECVGSLLDVNEREKAYRSTKNYSFMSKSMDQNQSKTKGCQCGPKRVLIVDDEEFNLIAFKTIVGSLLKKIPSKTIEVLVARDGLEGVSKFENAFEGSPCSKSPKCLPISLVIMDYNMPKMNGPKSIQEILQKFKKYSEIFAGKPTIYGFTSYMDQKYREELLEAGAIGFMKKPISINEMKEIIIDQL